MQIMHVLINETFYMKRLEIVGAPTLKDLHRKKSKNKIQPR